MRREVALSLRDVPFESARDVLLTLAAGYDGKDRSYLEAWGIGATHKEEALYAALAATAPDRDAAKWPRSTRIWSGGSRRARRCPRSRRAPVRPRCP